MERIYHPLDATTRTTERRMIMKYNEKMIIRSGKLIYAISLGDKASATGRNTAYIYTQDGKVQFADGWLEQHEFDFKNESHQIAKEIFITELQADIKRRILELKQLQSVFDELNLSECFGSVLVDNTKLLLEVKNEVATITKTVENAATKEDVETVIVDSVAPVALTKSAKKKKSTKQPVKENEDGT